MAFMSGLSAGNILIAHYGHKVTNPVLAYVIAEILIGTTGVLSIFALPAISTTVASYFAGINEYSDVPNLIRFFVAFTVLLVPAVAMGTTLPVMQKLLYTYDNLFARSIGRLYGWNTLGAVSGTLLAQFLLIKHIGLSGTALTACLLNFLAALMLLKSVRPETTGHFRLQQEHLLSESISVRDKLIAPFITGLLLLALEVVWFRYMLLAQSGTSAVFAVMLAVVLLGIGVGGILITRIDIRRYDLDRVLQVLLLSAAFAVMAGFYIYQTIFTHYLYNLSSNFTVFLLAATLLMLPTCIISGMLFPLFGERLHHKDTETTKSTGLLTLVNTLGAAIGSALATFILLPELGVEKSILVLMLGYVLCTVFILTFRGQSKKQWLNFTITSVTIIIILIVVFPYGAMKKSYSIFAQTNFPKERLLVVREGLNETLQYYMEERLGKPYTFRLVTNNFSMSGTDFFAKRYMKLYAYFPYIMQDNIKNVLQISYGVGNTAEAITMLDTVEKYDIVDISKDVLELSAIIHKSSGRFPLLDDRSKVHIEDGRFFLQTTTNQYDLITGEPPPPKLAGVVNLYSQEYFSLMWNKLNPNGMVTYWLPVGELNDFDTLAIIKAFCLVFEDCSMWHGAGLEFMLVGSKGGIKPVSAERLRNIWNSEFAKELENIGLEKPGQFGTLFMADSGILNKLTEHALPVTDNFPQRISTDIHGIKTISKIEAYLMNTDRRKKDFVSSAYINSIFPKSFISESLELFKLEHLYTYITYTSTSEHKLAYWKNLSYILLNTDTRTLPMVFLRSSPTEQAVLDNYSGVKNSEYQLALIKKMLVQRDFGRASNLLSQLIKQSSTETERQYLAKLNLFTLSLDGKLTKNLLKELQTEKMLPNDQKFLDWLNKNYLKEK